MVLVGGGLTCRKEEGGEAAKVKPNRVYVLPYP